MRNGWSAEGTTDVICIYRYEEASIEKRPVGRTCWTRMNVELRKDFVGEIWIFFKGAALRRHFGGCMTVSVM